MEMLQKDCKTAYVYIIYTMQASVEGMGCLTLPFPQAFYTEKCRRLEVLLREAYQAATGISSTPEGNASPIEGVIVDKCTGKFMASFNLGKEGILCKIFATRQDAEFWYDSIRSLAASKRLIGNLKLLRETAATRKATADAIAKITSENVTLPGEDSAVHKKHIEAGKPVSLFETEKKTEKKALPPATIRLHKSMIERLSTAARSGKFEARLLGTLHQSLGWRPTLCICLGSQYGLDDVTSCASSSGLTLLGVVGSSDELEPPAKSFELLQPLTTGCTSPIYVHFAHVSGNVTYKTYQWFETGVQEVDMQLLVRRINQESFQTIGLSTSDGDIGPQVSCLLLPVVIRYRQF